MGKKNREDKLADELIKRHEDAEKLKRMGSKAAGLASLLTKMPKIDLMRKETMKRLPVVFMNLCHKREFYQNKSEGNVINLDKEIVKCETYLDAINENLSINKAIEILDWTDKMGNKYGFETF
jgi:hypothetical protein